MGAVLPSWTSGRPFGFVHSSYVSGSPSVKRFPGLYGNYGLLSGDRGGLPSFPRGDRAGYLSSGFAGLWSTKFDSPFLHLWNALFLSGSLAAAPSLLSFGSVATGIYMLVSFGPGIFS